MKSNESFEKISVIGSQFVLYLIEEPGWTDEMNRSGSAEADPQQAKPAK
jgi:hypothetical protein